MTMLEDSNLSKASKEDKESVEFSRQDSVMSKAGFTGNMPVKIECGQLRFIITDSPKKDLNEFSKTLSELGVKHICRAADLNYSTATLGKAGIFVHEMSFNDGGPPPQAVLSKWLTFVEDCFGRGSSNRKSKQLITVTTLKEKEYVAVQCVAGLGRGPLLVAVALVEFSGLSPKEAVNLIRSERRGAINEEQLKWLEQYKPSRKHGLPECQCNIS